MAVAKYCLRVGTDNFIKLYSEESELNHLKFHADIWCCNAAKTTKLQVAEQRDETGSTEDKLEAHIIRFSA
jgi:hypothetical protein